MKKILLCLLAILLSLGVLCACNDSTGGTTDGDTGGNDNIEEEVKGTEGLAYELTEDGSGYVVVGLGTASAKEMVIPSKHEGKPVVGIGEGAFDSKTHITSVKIPNSVKTIESRAFGCCTQITTVSLGASVETIGESAFKECTKLQSISLPQSVKSIEKTAFFGSGLVEVSLGNVEHIGERAFSQCNALVKIEIPASVKTMESEAFSECKELANAKIADGITVVGEAAFFKCTSLVSVEIPASVTVIEEDAFLGCIQLSSVSLPEGLTDLGPRAFGDCRSLVSIEIPSSVVNMRSAFHECSALETIKIPEGVTDIGSFERCFSLKSIEIPDGVTKIGSSAFFGCRSLKNLVIPDTVTAIGKNAFDGCNALESITLPFLGGEGLKETTLGDCFGSNTNLRWLKKIVITGGTIIPDSAFEYQRSMTELVLPAGITHIGEYALASCTGLTTIHFGGTKAEWETITKDAYWNLNTGEYTVICIDGTIQK